MDEDQKKFLEFVFRLFGKSAVVWLYQRWSERRSNLILLDIPRVAPPVRKKPAKKKHAKKKTMPQVIPPPAANQRGRFCPECGQERR